MIISLNSSENKRNIANLRSQIKDAGDLKKFDEFLAKHDSFDFANSNDAAAARKCCGGEKCCETINVTVSYAPQ